MHGAVGAEVAGVEGRHADRVLSHLGQARQCQTPLRQLERQTLVGATEMLGGRDVVVSDQAAAPQPEIPVRQRRRGGAVVDHHVVLGGLVSPEVLRLTAQCGLEVIQVAEDV